MVLEAPAQRVWDVTVDIVRWPAWNSTVERVEVLTDGPVRVGTRARLKQPGNRPAVWAVWVVWAVVRIDAGHELVWERTLGTIMRAHHLLGPLAAGTKVTLGIEVQGATQALLGGSSPGSHGGSSRRGQRLSGWNVNGRRRRPARCSSLLGHGPVGTFVPRRYSVPRYGRSNVESHP